jgi:RNA polymerase sigma-70 factor (ECF subfamily)
MAGPAEVRAALAEAYRGEWSVVFGTLVRLTGDWELAEDCTQDAFVRALPAWERAGVPRNPGAWLVTTARRRAVDILRRRGAEKVKLAEVLAIEAMRDPPPPGDERLRLIFTCCHPALPLESRVPLTLRAVAGMTTREIARAFLVGEDTISQRILRAKRKIADAGIPYRVPPAGARRERLDGVLSVIYLVFSEGYAPSDGRAVRDPLAEEAIRLARLVAAEMPDEPEAQGLLALLLLQHSRRAARLNDAGELVTLENQDRTQWDQALISEGVSRARRAVGYGGPYGIQAAIALQHAIAPTPEATDWVEIVRRYDQLLALRHNPMVALSRAVGLGMRDGPEATLAALAEIGAPKELLGNHLVPAVRADALRRLGRAAEATEHYRLARELAPNAAIAREYDRHIADLTKLRR